MPRFRRVGPALVTDGTVGGEQVAIVKPQTYMNRSGAAIGPLLATDQFDCSRDMLITVDDYALPLGRFRLRRSESRGGKNS